MTTKKTAASYSPEVRERAVRLVLEGGGDHPTQWAAISSVAAKFGCTAETLRKWVRRRGREGGERRGRPRVGGERIKAPERGVGELREASETLRKAWAFCPRGDLDRRSKT